MDNETIRNLIAMGWNLRDWFAFHPENQEKCRDFYLEELTEIAKRYVLKGRWTNEVSRN